MATIDVEDETILTAIFKDSFPDSWKDNPDFVQYLAELSSFGIEKLSREPERLSEEKSQILEETQDLAFHNYKTFIQTAECSREIFEDFQIIEKHVENLLEKLPPFSNECENIAKRAQEINSSRRMNSLTLQRHTQLLEILEMPQLMDTCVRNGYYEEALELTAHVKRLEKKHCNIPVIANIVNEVKNSTQLMLNQLIQQLRTNIQLPLCLRVIGYLRRMDVFSEAELRIKFLQARDTWFQSILDAIPRDDAYIHITKTIEASRVHLFDIITQYRAIFSDEDSLISSQREDFLHEASLFHSWVIQKVSQFLTTLKEDLEYGVGGRLDSLLGQCMYFSLSFSRVGADFRGLLAPIFQQAALNGFQLTLNEANKKFEDVMQSYNLMTVTSTGTKGYNMSFQPGQLFPPSVLLDFQPLAMYCNHLLSAFNDLRLCAPLSLACDVNNALQNSLLAVNRVILSFHRAEEPTFNTQEREHFQYFLQVYTADLLPYLNQCLQTLFPPTQLAQLLGITIAEMSALGNSGSLDLTIILDSLSHLLPEKEEEVSITVEENLSESPTVMKVSPGIVPDDHSSDTSTQLFTDATDTNLPQSSPSEKEAYIEPSETQTIDEFSTETLCPSEASLNSESAVKSEIPQILGADLTHTHQNDQVSLEPEDLATTLPTNLDVVHLPSEVPDFQIDLDKIDLDSELVPSFLPTVEMEDNNSSPVHTPVTVETSLDNDIPE